MKYKTDAKEKEIGIIMAAGLGTRMLPLTEKKPKPLIKVHGIPMIETVICGLRSRGIRKIYIVVGYLEEQFRYLADKYDGVQLVRNTEYLFKNNISSLYAVGEILGSADCFICEADLYISDNTIFQRTLKQSCYYGKWVEGFSDDWVFEVDENNKILHIGIGGHDVFNMVGISYWKRKDAKLVADAIRCEYQKVGHEKLYWDEVVDKLVDTLEIGIQKVSGSQIVEIDTVAELIKVNGE